MPGVKAIRPCIIPKNLLKTSISGLMYLQCPKLEQLPFSLTADFCATIYSSSPSNNRVNFYSEKKGTRSLGKAMDWDRIGQVKEMAKQGRTCWWLFPVTKASGAEHSGRGRWRIGETWRHVPQWWQWGEAQEWASDIKKNQDFLCGPVVGARLPMQGTGVWSLMWEDSTCRGATKAHVP